jgi:hypothetical protein
MTDLTLQLPMDKYSYFNQKKMKGMYEEGYEYTKEQLSPVIIEKLNLLPAV